MELHSEYLAQYLRYTDRTEPSKLYHLWAGLSVIAAMLERRTWLEWGISTIYPNHYIVLVGPPAARKSTAVVFAEVLMKAAGYIKFGPKSTAGYKQGLLDALAGATNQTLQDDFGLEEALASLQDGTDEMPSCALTFVANELINLLGTTGSGEFLTQLTDLWDCPADADYKTARKRLDIPNPCVNLLGACSTEGLALGLSEKSIGLGTTSRFIFVAQVAKENSFYKPSPPDAMAKAWLVARLKEIRTKVVGPMTVETAADSELERMYNAPYEINDPRFAYYYQRRQTHLLKLSMLLAAGSLRTTVLYEDIQAADWLLSETEVFFPEAFGELGLQPQGLGIQRLMETMHNASNPIPLSAIAAFTRTYFKPGELPTILAGLVSDGKIARLDHNALGEPVYVALGPARRAASQVKDVVVDLLAKEFAHRPSQRTKH